MLQHPVSVGRLINFSANTLNQMCNNLLADYELSLPQWVLLSALWQEDGMLVSELAKYSGTNPPAVSRIIDRMAASDLVKRQSDPNDLRTVRVYLSDKAEKIRLLATFYKDINNHLMAGFTAEEKEMFIDLLERTLENASIELEKLQINKERRD